MRKRIAAMTLTKTSLPGLISLLFLVMSVPSAAGDDCVSASDACATVGEWEFKVALGAGKRSNPLENSEDIPLIVVPQVSYYGERFFLENLELGYTLAQSRHFMLNAILTPGRDRGFFLREDINNFFIDGVIEFTDSLAPDNEPPSIETIDIDDLHKRRLAGLAGIELDSDWYGMQWQLQLLQDITSVHQGKEVRFALGTASETQNHRISASAGFTWKSESLLDYYYGITIDEAGDSPFAYNPDSGFTSFVRLAWQKKLSARWRLNASVQYEHLSQEISDSPIVEEDYVVQFFVGGLYHF